MLGHDRHYDLLFLSLMQMNAIPFNKRLATYSHKCLIYLPTVLSYLIVMGLVAICTILCLFLHPYLNDSNLIMIYMLVVIIVATWQGEKRGPSSLAALLCAVAFDYFFTPPRFSLSIAHSSDIITLLIMLFVAQVVSQLTIHVRRHAEVVRNAKIQIETERFRNTLLTSISHDFRTPLTAIMGSASSLLQLNPENENLELQRELAQNIYDESDRLKHIVNNILQLIRLESKTINLSKQIYPLDEIIGSALNALEKTLTERPLKLELPNPSLGFTRPHVDRTSISKPNRKCCEIFSKRYTY